MKVDNTKLKKSLSLLKTLKGSSQVVESAYDNKRTKSHYTYNDLQDIVCSGLNIKGSL